VQARQTRVFVPQCLQTGGQVLLDIGVVSGHEMEREVVEVLERVDLDDVEAGVAVVEGQRLFGVELQLELGAVGFFVLLAGG